MGFLQGNVIAQGNPKVKDRKFKLLSGDMMPAIGGNTLLSNFLIKAFIILV